MNITLSVDEEVLRLARQHAEAIGKSVNQLVREYLQQIAGVTDHAADAEEWARLSRLSKGNSHGWKWNREEIQRK
ncbi:MAG: DUF6364 family protein [Candidatus Solibacter sp.]